MKRLASIGECLLEFSPNGRGQFRLDYAGDTYNVAVYCHRCAPQSDLAVDYVTAVGDDPFSAKMLQVMQEEGIGVDQVVSAPGRRVGLYLISNDSKGERQFYYYRSEAPVRDLLSGDQGQALAQRLLQYDALYFSGITLAVMHSESRAVLLDLLKKAKQAGKQVIFDNNFRPTLWPSVEQARDCYRQALSFVTIALPSFEDSQRVFGDQDPAETAQRLLSYGVDEVVVKQGDRGYYLATAEQQDFVAIEAVSNVVDTTSAGDSFNGGYLARRLTGSSAAQAARFAAKLAAVVIQHRGAIIPLAVMQSI